LFVLATITEATQKKSEVPRSVFTSASGIALPILLTGIFHSFFNVI